MSFVSEDRRVELELFLLLARPQLLEADIERVIALSENDLDWDFLIALARRHRLVPLLHKHVDDAPSLILHEKQREKLEQLVMQNSARATFLVDTLHRVLDLLKDHEIRALSLKGPVLGVDTYHDPALREFDDLDILVGAVDIPRVHEALAEGGLRPRLKLTPRQTRAYIRSRRDWVYTDDAGKVIIDVNTAVSPGHFATGLRVGELIRSAVNVSIGGRDVVAPRPEDMLLILCIHGSYHFWDRIAWITDIAALVGAHPDMDWDAVAAQAARTRCYRMLGVGLLSAADLFQASIPEKVMTPFRYDDNVGKLLLPIYARVRESGSLLHSAPRDRHMRRLIRDSLWDWVRDMSTSCLVPTVEDWRAVPLPDVFFPLYYALRPFRLAGDLLRGICGNPEESKKAET